MGTRALALVMPLTMVVSMVVTGRAGGAELKFFHSSSEIVAALLAHKPRVVAFGEYHQVEGGAKVPSAVKRFTVEMLADVAAVASDLVLETWVTEGKCGATETQAVAKVDESIKRPEVTEDELVTLLQRAKSAGVRPHILTLSCAEYAAIQPKDGEIDYVKLLGVVTDQLHKGIDAALKTSPSGKAVVVYGGALHNDVKPKKELAQFSFAKPVSREVNGRYLEVDLYVPEYVEHDREISVEPWFVRWQKEAAAHPGEPALVTRGPTSYVVIFPMTMSSTQANPSPAPEKPQHP
jgi:hypothetical protein